jgi:hypothetical protein
VLTLPICRSFSRWATVTSTSSRAHPAAALIAGVEHRGIGAKARAPRGDRPPARLRLLPEGADSRDEPRHAGALERMEELLEWPGRVQVRGLLLQRCLDSLGREIEQVEEEIVGVPRLPPRARTLHSGIREVGGHHELGVGGDRAGEQRADRPDRSSSPAQAARLAFVHLRLLESLAHRVDEPLGAIIADAVRE